MDSGKIEERAIKALEDIIDKHDTMESRINKGDKYMSWDGSIVIYKSLEVRSKKTYDYDIPVQVKGHVDKENEYLMKKRITYQVDLSDLQLYGDNFGCVYFQIFISEDAQCREIFYTLLYPSKAVSYSEEAIKKGKKSKSIAFSKLEKNANELYNILKQFSNEVTKQGSGRGQIVPKMIRLNELGKVRSLTANAVGAKDEYDFINRLGRGDICIYGNLQPEGIQYPIEWMDGGTFYLRKEFKSSILAEGTQYYSSYEVQMTSDGSYIVYPSKNLEINISTGKMAFKPVTNLQVLRHDVEFLADVASGKRIIIDGRKKYVCKDIIMTDEQRDEFQSLIILDEIFKEIGVIWNSPFSRITEENLRALEQIVRIKKGETTESISLDQYSIYNLKLEGRYYPILIDRTNGSEIKFYNAVYTEDILVYAQDGDDNKYRVPPICALDYEIMGSLYEYDYERFKRQIDYSVINEYTANAVLHAGLKLISAFDQNGDEKLLGIAQYALEKLKTIDDGKAYLVINELQIKKRMSSLCADDLKMLEEIKDEDPQIRFCVSVLRGDKSEAKKRYEELDESTKTFIEQYPIMTIYKELLL